MPLDQLQTYKPPLTAEPDFAAFWDAALEETRREPVAPRWTPIATPLPVAAFRLSWERAGGGPIGGRLVLPPGSGRHPLVVLLHGLDWYPASWVEQLALAGAGLGSLSVELRGQDEPSPDGEIVGGGSGWLTLGLDDPARYFYRAVYLDCVRGVWAAEAHPAVDADRIATLGISQGGGLSAVLAGLLPDRVRAAVVGAPYLTHFRRAVEVSWQSPYEALAQWFRVHDPLHRLEARVYRTLSYFDALNFAPRIAVGVLLGVGLLDNVCPPSTGFAFGHHVAGPVEWMVFPEANHSLPPPFMDRAVEWLARALKA